MLVHFTMARLMCSKDRAEVELVKKHLFKAGIPSEIRSNPLAAALRVTRLELWVQDERDYFRASQLYSGMQARGVIDSSEPVAETPARAADFIEVDEPA